MASSVDVANEALDHLNQRPIISLDDPTDAVEEVLSRWINRTRQSVLRKHTWNFATERTTLASLDEDIPFGEWDYVYQLSADFIRMVSLGEENKHTPNDSFRVEGNRIYTRSISGSSGELYIKYIKDFTDIDRMDPLFRDLWALELAYRTCMKVTGDRALRNDLAEMIENESTSAFSIDGQDNPPIRVERSRIMQARRGHGHYSSGKRVTFED